MSPRPSWFWPAICLWMFAVWVAAAIWCAIDARTKRRSVTHPTTTPEEGNHA